MCEIISVSFSLNLSIAQTPLLFVITPFWLLLIFTFSIGIASILSKTSMFWLKANLHIKRKLIRISCFIFVMILLLSEM